MNNKTRAAGLQQRVRSGLQRHILRHNIQSNIPIFRNRNISKIALVRSGWIEFAVLFTARIEMFPC